MCALAGLPPSTAGCLDAHHHPTHLLYTPATGLTQYSTGFFKTTFQPAARKSRPTKDLRFKNLLSHRLGGGLSTEECSKSWLNKLERCHQLRHTWVNIFWETVFVIVRHSPPRHSPPPTFTTPNVKCDIHHPRHSPPPM